MKTIHDQVNEKAKVKVNISVKAVKKKDANLIKGKPIEGIQHIIAVASGKGGVGKSTVTANLAVSLSNMGFKVGVLDADIYGPSMPIMFDVANERPLAKNIDGVSKMVPVANFGVKLLSIGFFTKPDQAVIWRGPMAAKALNRLGSMMSLHFTVPSLPMTTRPEVFIFPSKVPSIRKSSNNFSKNDNNGHINRTNNTSRQLFEFNEDRSSQGFSYTFSDDHQVFFNGGFNSRQPWYASMFSSSFEDHAYQDKAFPIGADRGGMLRQENKLNLRQRFCGASFICDYGQ